MTSPSFAPLGTGSPISLLPRSGGWRLSGRLEPGRPGTPSGPLRVRLHSGVHGLLHGTSVWLTTEAGDSPTVVFEAVATGLGPRHRGLAELSELRPIATDQRRGSPRATVARPVLMFAPGRTARGTVTVDLSREGCRLILLPEQQVSVGEAVQLVLEFELGGALRAEAVVASVDDYQAQAVLRFTRISPEDRDRLEREVLSHLSAESRGDGAAALPRVRPRSGGTGHPVADLGTDLGTACAAATA